MDYGEEIRHITNAESKFLEILPVSEQHKHDSVLDDSKSQRNNGYIVMFFYKQNRVFM